MAHSGSCQPRRTSRIHACPVRSNAFSWPASVTAGHPCSVGRSASLQNQERGGPASPRTARQRPSST
eukprot:5473163-Lingulodinium_polyedra.AAC.1